MLSPKNRNEAKGPVDLFMLSSENKNETKVQLYKHKEVGQIMTTRTSFVVHMVKSFQHLF